MIVSERWLPQERHTCGDCGALEGQFHQPGCDTERCPFCLGQMISCNCRYKHFYPNYDDRLVHDLQTQYQEALRAGFPSVHPTHGLPEDVYKHGLPDEQSAEWDRLLEAKGLIPYMVAPNLCCRCGECWPEMFHADDWKQVIPRDMQDKILCQGCYEVVKGFVVLGASERKGGKP